VLITELYEDDSALVTANGYGHRPHLHPLDQVRGYCEYLVDFLPALGGPPESTTGSAPPHTSRTASSVSG
jgi:hypothetical protein